MNKYLYILIFLFVASISFADPVPVFTDGTNTFYGTGTNYLNTTKAELCFDNIQQTFTAASGFEVVTNLCAVSRGSITANSTSLVVNVEADLVLWVSVSFASSVVNVYAEGHVFTNGVEVSAIGWSRKIATTGDQGSAAGSGLLLDVPSGTVITFRIDVDKNATLDFDHLSIMAIKQ